MAVLPCGRGDGSAGWGLLRLVLGGSQGQVPAVLGPNTEEAPAVLGPNAEGHLTVAVRSIMCPVDIVHGCS